jgi:hypothetical protein
MKRFPSRWKLLVAGSLVLLGVVAHAGRKDALVDKLEAVSREFFGKTNAWQIGGSESKGLFSPDSQNQIPTIPIQSHAGYSTALSHLKDLKKAIEEESVKRSQLDYGSRKYENLVSVAAKYVEIQKALYLNLMCNVHELGVSPQAMDIDALNLKVEAGVGGQLMILTELQKRYSVRHVAGDKTLGKAELFIPPYERMSLEVLALTKAKTKVGYQKWVHLMHLRDSLVNRWAISRVFEKPLSEGIASPSKSYAIFAEETAKRPLGFEFSKDLGVEDRYEERITSQVEGLTQVLSNQPLGSPIQAIKMVREFYSSFAELRDASVAAEAIVADLYHVEESTLARTAKQVIVESSYPQDDLSASAIAERIATNAFRVRKASILATLIRRIRIDIAAWRGFLEPDENGMVSEEMAERAGGLIRLLPTDLALAEKAIDPLIDSIEASWKAKLVSKIEDYYRRNLAGGEAVATKRRYAEFFNRVLDDSIDGVLGAKQVKNYNAFRLKLRSVSYENAEKLKTSGVPVDIHCIPTGMGNAACNFKVNADAYLARLDAQADLGMSWVTPWLPSQIADIFSKKIEFIEKHDPATWKQIQSPVKDKALMKQVAAFLEELNRQHQQAIQAKQAGISKQILSLSTVLAKEITRNPNLDVKGTQTFRKIEALQKRLQDVGQTPEESVLTNELYTAAAHKVFKAYLDKISTPPVTVDNPAPEEAKPATYPKRDYMPRMIIPSRWETISPRDATYVKPVVSPQMISSYTPGNDRRAQKMVELGKLFSLLGFGQVFFGTYKYDSKLYYQGKSVEFVVLGGLLPKPKPSENTLLGNLVRSTPRSPYPVALAEISRSAAAQRFLGESVMAATYTRAPFLRIQAGEGEDGPTGLERIEAAYDARNGWNRDKAHGFFLSLLQTAIQNDRNKVEDAILANPLAPSTDERFKKIFRAQAHNRSLLISAVANSSQLKTWDAQLKSETRTTAEKWNDRVNTVATVLFCATIAFLLWEFLPVLIPALGASIPTASAFFGSFSVLGMSGSVLTGFLSGSNFFVQLFFMSMVVVNGQVAFFTLPAQLQYQKELANSTVGLTSMSHRIVAPAERASRENIQTLQDEIRMAKVVTGVIAVVQGAFLPLQIRQLSRGFGVSGKVALSRLGRANPALAESMRAYSLPEMVKELGYARGAKMYAQRYTTAFLEAKPVAAVNGGAHILQAQALLAESLSTHLSSSSEVIALFESRLTYLKDAILKNQQSAKKYFAISQGAKTKDMGERLNVFFAKELSRLGFRIMDPNLKIYIRERVAQAIQAGEFSEIEIGTEKHLLKAFLLRLNAEKLMQEAIFLRKAADHLKALEAASGGVADTREVFAGFVLFGDLKHLDDMLKWAIRNPEYEGSAFGSALRSARQARKDFNIIADDIQRLGPKERAHYEAMNGQADVVVDEELNLKLGAGEKIDPDADEFLVIPSLPYAPAN